MSALNFSTSLNPAGLALVSAIVLACLLNPSFGPSPQVLQSLLALGAAIAWLLLRPRSLHRAATWLALAFVLAATTHGVIGIVQYFGAIEHGSLLVSAASLGEAYGNLRQRNQLATLLAIGLASAWFLRSTADDRRARWALGLSVVVMSTACALTSSRTGLLQWLILCGLAFIAPWRGAAAWWRSWALLAAGAYALALWLVPPLVEWTTGQSPTTLAARLSTDLGCFSRKVLWSNALYLIAQHPWVGWGIGAMDYAHHVTLYPGERFCLIVDNAHNLLLHVGVELGLPAALLLLAALLLAVVGGRPWRERAPHRLLAWAMLGVILLHSMLEYPLWYGPFQLAFLLAASLLWREAGDGLPAWRQPQRWMIAGLATAALAYVAWDYHRMSQLFLAEDARSAAYRGSSLDQARRTVLFRGQVEFADFTTIAVTPANAARMAEMGERVMYYSPEPRVIKPLVQAWLLQGRTERAAWHLERMCAAFETEWIDWLRERPELAQVAPERCPKPEPGKPF